MKPKTLLLTIPLVLCIAAALAPTESSAQDPYTPPDVQLVIKTPEPGKTYSRWFHLTCSLTGPRECEFELELNCFETTHHFLAARNSPGRVKVEGDDTRALWHLQDLFTLPTSGEQVCRVRLYDITDTGVLGERHLLLEREVKFRYEPLTGEEYTRELSRIQRTLVFAGWDAASDDMDSRGRYGTWQDAKTSASELKAARNYMDDLHHELFYRVSGYAQAAWFYEFTMQPGMSLSALKRAQAIWDAECGVILNVPPSPARPIIWRTWHWERAPGHYDAWAKFYARRKDLDRAVHWYRKSISYYLHQLKEHPELDKWHKDMCRQYAAHAIAEIAKLHYALKRDRTQWDLWMEKYLEVVPDEMKEGLLGR